MKESLISPDRFVGLDRAVHLCTGGEGPWLKEQGVVFEDFSRRKSSGYDGRQEIYDEGERCRSQMGALWNVAPDRIAFAPSAAEGMGWLPAGMKWEPGDNVVTTNLEFPSVAYAWRRLQDMGVEVRLVPHRNWLTEEDDLLAAVDDRTRVLAVSHVSFYTGQCVDLQKLAAVREAGVLLAVDATHSAGALVVDASVTDLTVSSCYKWLLGTHGTAPCYLSERAEASTSATCFGWRNLQVWPPQTAERLPEVEEKPMPERMEAGNPAMLAVLQLGCSTHLLLETGIDRIQSHDRALAGEVHSGLEDMGVQVISPVDPGRRSGNTCFLCEDAPALRDRLRDRGLLTWGEFGRMRISTHLHNSSDDVGRLLEALSDVM
jgi:selenocysteine lyase/cysteine desulfurase